MDRRQFELPDSDRQFLDRYGLPWEAITDGSQWVLLHHLALRPEYTPDEVIVALRIEVGYPQTPLDMAYFYPEIARVDGQPINATQATQSIDGKVFQRWSRHRTRENPWDAATDNLESHMILVEDWLDREFDT